MKIKKHIIKLSQISLLIVLFSINSCATFTYTNLTVTKPINVNPLNGKWLIDEPLLNGLESNYETITLNYYKNLLNHKFNNLKSIRDFNKQQTSCDYLISTKLDLIKNNDNTLTKELSIVIIVYDLNTKDLIFEKQYMSYDKFTGFDDIPLPSRLSRFMNLSIEKAIKDFGNKKNWSYYLK